MNLINVEIILIVVSLACMMQFGLLSLVQLFFKKYIRTECVANLEKFVLLFLCIPAVLISYYLIRYSRNIYQPVTGTDFALLKLIQFESFDSARQKFWFYSIVFALIWICGFAIAFLFIAIRENKILIHLKTTSELAAESDSIFLIKDTLEKEMNITKKIKLYRCNSIQSPFITGVLHPAIFIPTMEFPDDIFSLMLKHELYHYKNKDLLFRKIAILIKGIYWFNPFIFYFINKFFYNCEMVCDTQTLDKESNEARSKYAHTILNMIQNQKGMMCVSKFMSDDASHLEKRIENIMKSKFKKYKIATIVLSTMIIFMTPAAAYASTNILMTVQDEYARSIFNSKSTKESEYTYESNIEKTEKIDSKSQSAILGKAPRGANLIDCTVNSRTRAVVESLTFKKGDRVQFVLAGKNQSDSFKAGITDSNGYSRYVDSSKGTLSYTFTILTDGTYDLYIQGNTSSDVKVTGSVTL